MTKKKKIIIFSIIGSIVIILGVVLGIILLTPKDKQETKEPEKPVEVIEKNRIQRKFNYFIRR